MLNYFNTTGEAWVAAGSAAPARYFTDRAGTPDRQQPLLRARRRRRGAAPPTVSLTRQQSKIVTAINTLDADIVSWRRSRTRSSSVSHRDDALAALVTALNTAAGSTRWAYAPSPSAADLPPVADQDVIRNAFIYDPSTVQRVGASKVLVEQRPVRQRPRAAGPGVQGGR